MATASWIALEDALDPVLLTVQAQALPPNDTGEQLLWDVFFPRETVDSVKLQNIATLDYRPTADRREWNARGRNIPQPTPARREVEIVPIESYFKIDEQEIQRLNETSRGNAQIIRDLIGVSVPQRTDKLVQSNFRRIEVDAFRAWLHGEIIQRNPENAAQTVTVSFAFSGTRYVTEPTAWNDAGVNAYQLLLARATSAQDLIGNVAGAMCRLNTFNAILADAPNLPNSVTMTRTQLEERISEDLGFAFAFFINENSVDIFNDGGTSYTRTKVFTANKLAFIPTGQRIGVTAFAPVVRAQEIARGAAEAGIDTNGMTVYREVTNGGREVTVECQVNALPVPDEQRVLVYDVGV